MEIESKESQSIEDEISGEFCQCNHEISEHYIGQLTGTIMCRALIFNGAIYSSCNCVVLRQKQFKIPVMVEYYANCSQDDIAA